MQLLSATGFYVDDPEIRQRGQLPEQSETADLIDQNRSLVAQSDLSLFNATQQRAEGGKEKIAITDEKTTVKRAPRESVVLARIRKLQELE